MNYKELTNKFNEMEIIDLTHYMETGMPVWPTHPPFYHNQVESVLQGDIASHFAISLGEHCGTHLDAPRHFFPNNISVDNVELRKFYGRALKIEATNKGELGLLTAEDLKQWENTHVIIEKNDIILIHFGWDEYWNVKPKSKKFLANWPGLSEDGAKYLYSKKVKAVGTDALALDVFGNDENPTHKVLLSNNILIIENLHNLKFLPDEVFFSTWPLKIKDGSGSPIRAVAFYSKV